MTMTATATRQWQWPPVSATIAGAAWALALCVPASTCLNAAMPDHRSAIAVGRLAVTLAVAVAVPLLLTWRRPGQARRVAATIGIVLAVSSFVWSPVVADQLWPSPVARYQRELGGPAGCLNGTPYDWSNIKAVGYAHHQMTVVPSTRDEPLVLDHGYQGSTRRLTPATDATRAILERCGC